jgi:serine/threonine protein kinase
MGLPFPLNSLIDQYKLEKVLGKGASGIVYLGFDIFLERYVAIKVLKGKSIKSEESIERFRLEAIAMAKISHQNIVHIYSFGKKEGYYYFIMEYIEGGNLASLIENNLKTDQFLPLDVAIGLISQICSGLSTVHSRNIVHKDIKPANILICKKNHKIAITDFGLTSEIDSEEGSCIEGTPLYIAPERIKSQEIPQEKLYYSDIYSLGCIFFELLTGKPPYYTNNILELLGMHLNDEIPNVTDFRPDIPKYIDEVIKKAMAKNIEDRYSSCKKLKDDLLNLRMPGKSKKIKRPFIQLVNDTGVFEERITKAKDIGWPELNIINIKDPDNALNFALNEKPDGIVLLGDSDNYTMLEFCSILNSVKIPIFLVVDTKDTSKFFLFKELGVKNIFSFPLDPLHFFTTLKICIID